MEQRYKKNIIEKFGDFYSGMGRRALFSLGCILLGAVFAFTGVGAVIAVISVYNLISIFEKEKTRYIKSIQVKLSNGNVTTCALFEQKVYAYAPGIMAFFSIGFYIPYKKQYILVRNMEIKNFAEGTRVPSSFLTLGLLNLDIIPKSKYLAVVCNPQIISEELYAQILPRREAFLKETKPFVETGLIEEVYYTDNLSICKFYDDNGFVLFHYESHSGIQCGLLFNEDFVEKIKEDDSFLLESYIQMENPSVVFLTSEVLERLLRKRKNSNNDNPENINEETRDNLEKEAAAIAEAEKNYIDQLNKNRMIFTRDMIASRLKGRKCTGRMVWGIVLLYLSIYGIILIVLGISTGMIGAIVVGPLVWILFTYFGVKNIKTSKKNRQALYSGQYKIIKATCTKCVKEEQRDGDDNFLGYVYHHHFSNVENVIWNTKFAVEGDTVYLVYFNGMVGTYFNAIEYMPADDLVIEEELANLE